MFSGFCPLPSDQERKQEPFVDDGFRRSFYGRYVIFFLYFLKD